MSRTANPPVVVRNYSSSENKLCILTNSADKSAVVHLLEALVDLVHRLDNQAALHVTVSSNLESFKGVEAVSDV